MVGGEILTEKGEPILNGQKLEPSAYNPPKEVKDLFARCQSDYQKAWSMQHKPFDEFDGLSLLQRAKRDQETFGAYVGAEFVAQHKRWRWKGRKNTARNKLLGILAHMLAGMLFPNVTAQNEEDEPDKMTARVMRILIEEHLRKANYQMKFLYMILSALVNPAVIVEVDYFIAFQNIKEQLANGEVKITEVLDEFLSGLALNIIPVDQYLISDFYTPEDQKQPYVIKVERIPWDTARKIYGDKYFNADGKDLFEYVQAGQTRYFLAGQESQVLYDISWSEGDDLSVQVLTFFYRDEDLEVAWVGGVGMFNYKNPYNTNPFKHRRMSLYGDEWKAIPIYPFVHSGFEPLDPSGRFYYYKSGAFKEYWDDATQNKMHQLMVDGTYLDVIKPIFASGLSKVDSVVMAPGAVIGMPLNATVSPFQLGPNLAAAMNALNKQESDMSESTQDKIMNGQTSPDVTATQSIQAQNQARIMLGTFATMVSHLITQIGELTIDCIIQHTTVGELDASIPEALKMKYKTIVSKGKDKGKEITNRVIFTDATMGKTLSQAELQKREWALWDRAGGSGSDQHIYEVNPYGFARTRFGLYCDPDDITNHAMGNTRLRKMAGFQMFTNPAVMPYVDMKEVVDYFVIEEFAGNADPDRFKGKQQQIPQGAGDVNQAMQGVMGSGGVGKGRSAPSLMAHSMM